ncbi:MAG: AMP-binding protein [Candidatus Brocadiaceae bacterium]|nr:AMP-binding protein [Candidatus Brocadiaceae bacterium]
MTLVKTFLNTCKKHAHKIAIVDQQGSITYHELLEKAMAYGAKISSKATGNHIGILLPNSKEFAAVFYGTLSAGKVPVPLNFLLSPQQLLYILRNAEIFTVFTNTYFKQLLGEHIKHLFTVEEHFCDTSPFNEENIQYGTSEDIAALLYTSGTSAKPKGVMLSNRNFLHNLDGCIEAFRFSDKDVLLGVLPLFHTYALTTTLILPIRVGATIIYLARFSGQKVLEAIEKYHVTALFAIPSMYRALLRSMDTNTHSLKTLRLCTSGGELLPKDVLEAFNKTFPVPLTEGYGLTETTAIVSVNLPEKCKPGSIGPPLSNLEVKIIDDDLKSLPREKEGEIWVKGPNVMNGYYRLPKETAEAKTSDGWLKTGDYGKLDNEGFLWITGRKKELIIISGENVSPHEIEQVISGNEKVFEVAVVGVPDKIRGEIPKAYIALKENCSCSDEEMRDFCMQHLPHYKVPKYIEFLKELPHGPTGKILKRALK